MAEEMKFCKYEGCRYQHEWPSKIKQHVDTVHLQIKNFPCDQCTESFGRSFNLKRHKEIKHFQEKPFECEICKKKYTTKQNLDIHQKHFHENIETEQVIDNNEFDTLSVNLNCELESANGNVVAGKGETVRIPFIKKPFIRIEKITPAEIEIYRGGKKLQPRLIIRKLEDTELPQKRRKKCPTTTSEMNYPETLLTTKKRDEFKSKENVKKKSSKREKEIAKKKEIFVSNYNFDSWYNRSPPRTQKKTMQSIILDDHTNEQSVPKTRTLKEFNIFQYLDLEYTPPIRHRDFKYYKTKFYTGKP